jgi:HD-GYP domain-containing protein (c-di-GMP phosphodiesterase class II)
MDEIRFLPLSPRDVIAGIPLQCDLYTPQGRLILRSGGVVSDEQTVAELLASARKARREHTRDGMRILSAFSMMDAISDRLDAQFDAVSRNPKAPGFVGGIDRISTTLLHACDIDGDAAFAQPHLDCRHGYLTYHATMAAIVCALLSKASNLPESSRKSLIGAALTHDMALGDDRMRMDGRPELDAADRIRVSLHPEDSVRLLETLGVRDALWLRVVAQHHERLDGSGYPAGLRADDLGLESRIMALADAFSAMLRPRPYRDRRPAKAALAELYRNPGGSFDQEVIGRLIRKIGIYPAGTVVRLENGETAVIVRGCSDELTRPEACALIDADRQPLFRTVPRDVLAPGFGIAALLGPDALQPARRTLETVWDNGRLILDQ